MNLNMYSNRHSIGSLIDSLDSLASHTATQSHAAKPLSLLQSVLECLGDGILIVTDQGEVIHENRHAQQLCRQTGTCSSFMPTRHPAIWRICKALIKERDSSSDRTVILDEELRINDSLLRVRVRWLDLENVARPCLLITLEDQYESARYRALAEALKYGLTNRETEVWLLKRIGCTYKQIAARLHIAEDTVKKHVKNIYARREANDCLNN